MTVINNFSNVIQGAVLRNQIAHAKADGKVTTAEANALLAQAKKGGVTPSELAALKELAAASRNNTSFDAGAKAALNKFVGNDANSSHASGRLPPEANLPQILGFTDKARLSALDKHFKKDDGQIGQSEARSILRNIFKDGNVSPSERQYLTSKLNDPNVTPAAKNDIRLILSLVPGSRLPVGADGIIRPKWPRALPPPPPSGSTSTAASTGSTTSPSGPTIGFPTAPVPPRDSQDLAAQNMFQNMQAQFEQAVSKLISFWQGTGAVPAGVTTLQGALDATAAKVQAAVANGIPAGLTVPTPPKDPKDLAAVNKYFESVAAFQTALAGATPQTGSTGSTGTTGTSGTGGTSGTSGSGSTGSTGGTQYNGSFPSYPTPPKDPKDLAAQNKFQEDMFNFQQASQNMNTFWQMMQNTLKSMGDTANNAVRNLR